MIVSVQGCTSSNQFLCLYYTKSQLQSQFNLFAKAAQYAWHTMWDKQKEQKHPQVILLQLELRPKTFLIPSAHTETS